MIILPPLPHLCKRPPPTDECLFVLCLLSANLNVHNTWSLCLLPLPETQLADGFVKEDGQLHPIVFSKKTGKPWSMGQLSGFGNEVLLEPRERLGTGECDSVRQGKD